MCIRDRFKGWSSPNTDDVYIQDGIIHVGNTLDNDITLSEEWTQMPTFSGTFDGNGKSISGLYFNNIAIDGVSLFAITGESALVKNVTVTNSYFCGNYNNSAVVAINYGTVSSCFNEATLIGYAQIGGIVGRNLGLVELCGNTGAITGEMGYVGGIVGDNKSTVRNCWNTGNIQVDLNYVGGITGANNSSGTDGTAALTENCWSTGTVVSFGRTSAGGIVGAAWVNLGGVRNCYSLMKPVGIIRNAHPVTNAEQKTLDQFASGEVAYLLRTRAAEGTDVWGQNIDNGQTVQTVPTFDGADVYYGYASCADTRPKYTNNASVSATPIAHDWGYTATGAEIVGTCVNGCGADGGKVTLILDGTAVYDGTEKTVKADGSLTGIDTLPAVTYEGDRINAGTFTAYLTLEDGTKAQLKVTITAKEITPTIEGVRSTYSYNGEAIKPAVTVKDGEAIVFCTRGGGKNIDIVILDKGVFSF